MTDALNTFTKEIAHHFNNLHNVILGAAELSRRRSLSESDPGLADTELILNAANSADDLVRRLLEAAGQVQVARNTLQFESVLDEALKEIRPCVSEGVEISQRVDPGLPAIIGDRDLLHRVVVELCGNAMKALKGKEGEISLHVYVSSPADSEAAESPGSEPGRFVTLAVSDNGQGMDEATRARVFEPFYTGWPSEKVYHPDEEGFGLGLAVVRGIVEAHGGSVSVESKPLEGSTFSVSLPVGDEQDFTDESA